MHTKYKLCRNMYDNNALHNMNINNNKIIYIEIRVKRIVMLIFD